MTEKKTAVPRYNKTFDVGFGYTLTASGGGHSLVVAELVDPDGKRVDLEEWGLERQVGYGASIITQVADYIFNLKKILPVINITRQLGDIRRRLDALESRRA